MKIFIFVGKFFDRPEVLQMPYFRNYALPVHSAPIFESISLLQTRVKLNSSCTVNKASNKPQPENNHDFSIIQIDRSNITINQNRIKQNRKWKQVAEEIEKQKKSKNKGRNRKTKVILESTEQENRSEPSKNAEYHENRILSTTLVPFKVIRLTFTDGLQPSSNITLKTFRN